MATFQITESKSTEFTRLFSEFAATYPKTSEGQAHITYYTSDRELARKNWEELLAATERGADITELALFNLLPYADTSANRKAGYWISIAPAFTTDVRLKFEAAGWTKPEEWPDIAQAIFEFVRQCVENPEQLAAACAEFSALPYSKGFQTGTLTPILNALQPNDFILINNKSRRVLNHFAGTRFGQKLSEYPGINTTAKALVAALSEQMRRYTDLEIRPSDLFDMFCHWLVAVKNYAFGATSYWKIAPGSNAWNWDACREGGFITMGWDELGDLTSLDRAEFAQRLQAHPELKPAGLEQLWKFAHEVKEGDRIIANRGKTEIVGIGTVVGPYEFVPNIRHGHRLPVEWDDLTTRSVNERGWQRTLINLAKKKFEQLIAVSPIPRDLAEPFSRIFADSDEANWAFDFLRDTLNRLGVTSPDDERFALTLVHNNQTLRLNYGSWAVLQFYGSDSGLDRVGIAFLEDRVAFDATIARWERPFATDDNRFVRVYELPITMVQDWPADLQVAYEATFAYLTDRFGGWSASSVRRFNQPEIAAAVFVPERRPALWTTGIGIPITSNAYFDEQTFALLAALHATPQRAFYLEHKDEFKEQLEEPFRRLAHDVAQRLPAAITEIMETERGVFGRILKNDYGQGGAWDYCWGAFYPKGGKRTADPQLSLWINYERFECGFYIGEYGKDYRQRFQQRCQTHYEELAELLKENLDHEGLFFGRHEDIVIVPDGTISSKLGLTWTDWLRDPESGSFDASIVLPRGKVLQYTAEELATEIAQTFVQLFPLILLALKDDPIPVISKYLGLYKPRKPMANRIAEPVKIAPDYPLSLCAEKTSFDENELARWVRAIERKGQAILYGPPGTGKTYVAEHLAQHLIGGGDGFRELVQFHPAYAYEDFMQGIRPRPHENGGLEYPLIPGRFMEFCTEAEKREGRCVLIIDEINRANLSRVFGELMYLLEYRKRNIPLAGGERFFIPDNVLIIGTMNTADRSIALVDHALRRRFAFLKLEPNYNVLRRYHQTTGFPVEKLIKVVKDLNDNYIQDFHYQVGVTFFLRKGLAEEIRDIWEMEIEPYLEEYFFDQSSYVDKFRWVTVAGDILL